jgi:hypothetical protein
MNDNSKNNPSNNLAKLLQTMWSSPVFGNAYNPAQLPHTINLVEATYLQFATKFRPILQQGLPHNRTEDIDKLVFEIAPKSVAFCSAIASDIWDPNRLSSATLCIALSYWADQYMDDGDVAMIAASEWVVQQYLNPTTTSPFEQLHSIVKNRVRALWWIIKVVEELSLPEDKDILMHWVVKEGLGGSAKIADYNRNYLLMGDDNEFWQSYATETARVGVDGVGLILLTSLLYCIYRQHDSSLPALAEIFREPRLILPIKNAGGAAMRVFDDLGDRQTDDGHTPDWGGFCINLFNQPNPQRVRSFMHQAGIYDEEMIDDIQSALASREPQNQVYVVQFFARWVKKEIERIPPGVKDKFATFLTLSTRVIEAGYINIIGDIALVDPDPEELEKVTGELVL